MRTDVKRSTKEFCKLEKGTVDVEPQQEALRRAGDQLENGDAVERIEKAPPHSHRRSPAGKEKRMRKEENEKDD